MPQPVVHFEIIGKDPTLLRKYFSQLFDWKFDVPSPVVEEVSAPDAYGFLDLITTDDGTGIRGGIGGGPGYESHAVFYVGVPDVEAALQRAEELGGSRRHGSGDVAEWTRLRSFHRPRRQPHGRRRRLMTSFRSRRISNRWQCLRLATVWPVAT